MLTGGTKEHQSIKNQKSSFQSQIKISQKGKEKNKVKEQQ